ncbi:MAG: TCR/Tet family MFS transporter [Myxococcota bacterium]
MVTLLLDVLGLGLIIPVLPKLVTSFGGGDISESSGTFGWFVAVYALMQFLFSPVLGSLSDMYGRRPIILLSLMGAGLDYLMMAFAPSLEWLFVGRVISGITGANITAVNAYIADVSPPEKRAQSFGLLGAVFGIGFILGPALGGLLGGMGPRVPFMVASALNLLNAAYGFFILPESLPRERRTALQLNKANPLATLGVLGRYPMVLGLAVTFVLVSLAHQGLQSTWVLYTTYRYHWTEMQNGLSLSVVGICAAVVQGGLTGVLVKKVGERRALLLGMAITSVAFILYGVATEGWMLYAFLAVGSLGGIAGPSAQSLISRHVSPKEQGAVQGALAGLMSLTGIAGPVFFTHLFGYFTSARAPLQVPGVAFFAGAFFAALAVVFTMRSFARLPEEPTGSPTTAGAPMHG